MKIAIQMDPLEGLHEKYDSTLYLARAAALRGYELFHYGPQGLRVDIEDGNARVTASGHSLIFKPDEEDIWMLGFPQERALEEFDVILMRQDPPFDMGYIDATHILELVKGPRIVNDPVGVRNAPEKLLITHFPQLMPPTLISSDRKALEEFRLAYGDIIIKPLNGYAGHGVFHLRSGDDNLPALIETMAALTNEPLMAQKFLPVTTLGDKRIVLLDGEPVGCFRRMPKHGDIRGNMRVGAKPEAAAMTKRDEEICRTLAPELKKRGLFLCGLDVIGDYLTEINVTSPTGLAVADELAGVEWKDSIAEKFWDKILS